MKRVRFPAADKIIRKHTTVQKSNLAVKVTPFGADRHPRFGTMHPSRWAISIDETPNGYIYIGENEINTGFNHEGIAHLKIPSERARLASEFFDARHLRFRPLISRSLDGVKTRVRRMARRGASTRLSKGETILQLESENERLKSEMERLERMISVERGSIVDAITLGILPPVVEPPFPLRHVSKIVRGPDALSIHSPKPGVMALEFIEGNWTSLEGEPGFTASQRLFETDMNEARIELRLWHHYQDASKEWTWETLAERVIGAPIFRPKRRR